MNVTEWQVLWNLCLVLVAVAHSIALLILLHKGPRAKLNEDGLNSLLWDMSSILSIYSELITVVFV